MNQQDKDRWGAIASLVGGAAATWYGISQSLLMGDQAISFFGLLGRLLFLLSAWSLYRSGGFDPSRVMLASRNEQIVYQVVAKAGWVIAVFSPFFFAITIFLILASAFSSGRRRRRRYVEEWW